MPIISSQPPVDVVVCSKRGTGRTTAYTISILNRLFNLPNCCLTEKGSPQALVMVPSIMHVYNIGHYIQRIGKHLNVKVLSLVAGIEISETINSLNDIQHIIVGTPALILLAAKNGNLKLDMLKMLILDELEELFDRGFGDHIKEIMAMVKIHNIQKCVFYTSAVENERVNNFIEKELWDPVTIVQN